MDTRKLALLSFGGVMIAAMLALATEDPVPARQQGTADKSAPVVRPVTATPLLDVNEAELKEDRTDAATLQKSGEELQLPGDQHPPRNPLMPRISTLLEQERNQLADLEQQFRQAADEQSALAIQRRIREVKVETELAILRLQLDAARERGDDETVSRLEQAIATITGPRPQPVFVERDVPDVHQR